MTDQNKTHGVPWQVRHAAERTRADLKAGGTSYPDVRALLEYVESLIAAPQSPVAPADEPEALSNLYRAYVNLLEVGRDRIIDLGGQCDPVDVMERSDPALIEARARLAAAPTVSATVPDGEVLQIFADVTRNDEDGATYIDVSRDEAIQIGRRIQSALRSASLKAAPTPPTSAADAVDEAIPMHLDQAFLDRAGLELAKIRGQDPKVTGVHDTLSIRRQLEVDAAIRAAIAASKKESGDE